MTERQFRRVQRLPRQDQPLPVGGGDHVGTDFQEDSVVRPVELVAEQREAE